MPTLIPEQLGKILYKVTEGKSGKDLDQAIEAFTLLLKEKQMLSKFPYITEAFERYAKKQEGIVELEITTATKVEDSLIKQIEEIFGNKVETTTKTDPHIIGGLVAKAGNKILDASIKAQLNRMRQTL